MGRCEFFNVGYGMNERDAMRDARDTAMEENGHCEGYSGDINSATSSIEATCIRKPVPAKSCNVDKTKQEGTRKWKTVFAIMGGRWGEEQIATRDTQTEALKYAKEHALKTNESVSVEIKKVLVNGDTRIARISPKKSTMGKWEFSGMARC